MHLEERTFGELRDLADSVVLVAVAVDVGIFEALGKGAASAEELAAELGFDETATLVLLEALVGVGALERDAQLFRPTERTDRELCDPDLATYVGRGMPHWLRALGARTRLGEVLRGGGPLRPRLSARAPEDAARFTAAMAAAPRRRVERIVDLCLERNPGARSVLDVGGGPGHMTRAFARRGLRATLLDTPDIIAHVVGAHRLGDVANLEVFPADFTRDPLPAGPFDVVLISNVLHIYGPEQNRRLVRDVARVSAPDAVVAVAEFLRGRSRRAPDLSLRMLMTSESGKAYSEAEISSWLDEAGFGERRVDSLDEDRQLVTAVLGSAPRD